MHASPGCERQPAELMQQYLQLPPANSGCRRAFGVAAYDCADGIPTTMHGLRGQPALFDLIAMQASKYCAAADDALRQRLGGIYQALPARYFYRRWKAAPPLPDACAVSSRYAASWPIEISSQNVARLETDAYPRPSCTRRDNANSTG